MKMNHKELVKALRCCAEGDCWCCRLHNDAQRCQETLLGSAAELIERDQKEISELRAALENATEMDEFRACPLERRKSQTSIGSIAPTAGQRWMEGTKVNENFEKIKGRLGEAEVLAQLAEECAELAQAALKLRRALDGKNPTPNTEEERRRALLEEYTDVIHCALVLDLEMDLDQIRKKTERWMRRLGIGEEDGN